MTYVVQEFFQEGMVEGQFRMPADRITRVAGAGTLQCDSRTNALIISSAVGGCVSFNDTQVTTDDIPILTGIPNQFLLSGPPGGVLLRFT